MNHGLQFETLEPLDLAKCRTVNDLVSAMASAAFGARMIGEAAATLESWIAGGRKPILVYDGKTQTPLGRLLQSLAERGWFSELMRPEDYQQQAAHGGNIVVVGPASERHEDALYTKPERALFINQFGMAKPGQTRDGYFPDVVFADPRFVVPVLAAALSERMDGNAVLVPELIAQLAGYSGTARRVAEGAGTLKAMVDDPDCTVFMTVTGAMTMAKMGLIICDMIEQGMVHYLSTTGALMAHGLSESVGLSHLKYNPSYDDSFLAEVQLNRVTDTLEPEGNLDEVERIIDTVIEPLDGAQPISPRILNQLIGKYLVEHHPHERGILRSAYERGVPVFVPAFVDSEIGNDVYLHNRNREAQGKPPILIDLELDSAELVRMAIESKRMGIFTIGGGVPRNNTQNVAPLIEIMNVRQGLNLPISQFAYGCRIAPDEMHYGHLSGCTYSEGVSWRKMNASGRFTEIQADATQVWPFLAKYVMETRAEPSAQARAEVRFRNLEPAVQQQA